MKKNIAIACVLLVLTACIQDQSLSTISTSQITSPTTTYYLSDDWNTQVEAVTKDWQVYSNTAKGISFKYPANFYNLSCPPQIGQLKVLESSNGLFLVPTKIMEVGTDGQTLCNKTHDTTLADLTMGGTGMYGFQYLTIYTKNVTSREGALAFYQQLHERNKVCTLEDFSEYTQNNDSIESLFLGTKNKDDFESAMDCGNNVVKYNKTKGIVAIYHGKLNGGWLYTDASTSVDGELTETIKFL